MTLSATVPGLAEFEDAAAFLDFALTANVSAIPVARAKYTMILSDTGGIIDDLITYQTSPGVYLVIAGLSLKWGTGAAAADPGPQVTQGGN